MKRSPGPCFALKGMAVSHRSASSQLKRSFFWRPGNLFSQLEALPPASPAKVLLSHVGFQNEALPLGCLNSSPPTQTLPRAFRERSAPLFGYRKIYPLRAKRFFPSSKRSASPKRPGRECRSASLFGPLEMKRSPGARASPSKRNGCFTPKRFIVRSLLEIKRFIWNEFPARSASCSLNQSKRFLISTGRSASFRTTFRERSASLQIAWPSMPKRFAGTRPAGGSAPSTG